MYDSVRAFLCQDIVGIVQGLKSFVQSGQFRLCQDVSLSGLDERLTGHVRDGLKHHIKRITAEDVAVRP